MKKTTVKVPKIKKISVVFVCTGNTCRSPVAERIFKHNLKKTGKLTKFRVSSAGLSASDGSVMTELSAQVLKEASIPYTGHKARYLNEKTVYSTDYFICMTEGHKRALQGLPDVYSVAEITNGADVCDPYGGTYTDYKKMFDYLFYAMPEIEAFIEKCIAKKALTDKP